MSTHESDPALEKTVSAEDAGVTPGGAAGDGGRLTAGTKLGRYEIVEFIGGGGMGWVYRAKDTELEREVAIKVVQPAVAGAKGRDRLLAEARAMAKLRHRAVVPVFDVGEYAGGVYVAMALVKGGTLHDWMHAEPRPWRQVVARFLEAGRGLVAAHAAGIVHRDFKPRNVLLGDGGEVMVADFGIASASVEAADDGATGSAREATSIVGTPAYMAPEQAVGLAVDARADQYSFCVSLWEGLHGQRPQEAETRTQRALLSGSTAAPKSRRRVPGWLTDAVARGFAPAPDKRWPTLAALLDHVERGTRRRRRMLTIAGALVGAATVVSATTLVGRTARSSPPTCQVPQARIEATWNAERGARLRTLLVALDPLQGRTRAERAVDAFESATRQWGGAVVRACRETRIDHLHSEGVLTRRMVCLEHALSKITASVAALEGAQDLTALEGRLRVLDNLPQLESCSDIAQLAVQPGPPTDPALLAEYNALLSELAVVDVERLSGDVVSHRRRASAAVERARALGHPVLLARLLDQYASALHNDGDYDEEVRVRREAIAVGAEARDDLIVADMWTSLVSTVADALGRPDEAEALLLSAEAAVARAGNPVLYRYDLMQARVLIAKAKGDLTAALTLIDEGIALLEKNGARSPGSDLMNRLFLATGKRAMVLRKLRRPQDSIAGYEDTIGLVTAKYGPEHAFLAPYLANLSQAQFNAGDHKAAVETMRRSLAISLKHFGESARLAEMTWGLGEMLIGDEQFAAAMPYLERALEMARRTMKGDDERMADIQGSYGAALVGVGRLDEGIAQMKESLVIYGKGQRSLNWGLTEYSLAEAESKGQRWDDAIASYGRARLLLEAVAGARSPEVAAVRLGPAVVWARQGRWARTLALAEDVMRDHFDDATLQVAKARFWRGAAMVELKRGGAAALVEARSAADALRAAPNVEQSVMEEVDAWLATRRGARVSGRAGAN